MLRRFAAALSLASVFFATAGLAPLHEMAALRGHETHHSNHGAPSIGHVCHDEDECAICTLLQAPQIGSADVAPAPIPVKSPGLAVPAPEIFVSSEVLSTVSARAPPTV